MTNLDNELIAGMIDAGLNFVPEEIPSGLMRKLDMVPEDVSAPEYDYDSLRASFDVLAKNIFCRSFKDMEVRCKNYLVESVSKRVLLMEDFPEKDMRVVHDVLQWVIAYLSPDYRSK